MGRRACRFISEGRIDLASIVVVAQGPQGLAAGARLAESGRVVRVLELAGSRLEEMHPDLLEYGTESEQRTLCVGPAITQVGGPTWAVESGDLRPAFQTKSPK